MQTQPKYRIVRTDGLNWQVQEWQEGGEIISRGRYAGQPKKSGWKGLEMFGPLGHLIGKMFDLNLGHYLDGDLSNVPAAIDAARAATVAAVQADVEALPSHFLRGLLEERGFETKEKNAKRGRKSYISEEDSEDEE